MIIYRNEHTMSIPIHLNLCFYPEMNERNKQAFDDDFLSVRFVSELANFIINSDIKGRILIDLKNVKTTIRSGKLFDSLKKIPKEQIERISFINANSYFRRRIFDEFSLQFSSVNGKSINLNGEKTDHSTDAYNLEHERIISIIKESTTKYDDRYKYLESSNIFLNRYVRLKDTFLKQEDFKILLYHLCAQIKLKYFDQEKSKYTFDGLISASPVGASIAICIGVLIGKPAVYLHSIGPKFALYNDFSALQKGATYLFIYDFICLGTEYKLINALSQCLKFYLLGGVGFASLVNPKRVQKALDDEKNAHKYDLSIDNSLLRIDSLVYVDDLDINYCVYLTQKE